MRVSLSMSEYNEVVIGNSGDGLQPAKLLTKCKEAVCYIHCIGKESIRRGSGFFTRIFIRDIEHRCIVTNNHVISCREDALEGSARFRYEGNDPGHVVKLLPDLLFYTNETLDYTVIGCDYETIQYSHCIEPLDFAEEETEDLQVDNDIFIFQHPKGLSKMFSYQKISNIDKPFVYYKADTDIGSSGSPVFRKWKLLAVHSKGSDALQYNKGTLCSEIISHLNHGTYTPPKPLLESSIALKRKIETSYQDDEAASAKQSKPLVSQNGIQDTKNVILTETLLHELSRDIIPYWKHLGRKLTVPNAIISSIHKDHINYDDIGEKAFAMLMAWKEGTNDIECLVTHLAAALKSLKKVETSQKYCGM